MRKTVLLMMMTVAILTTSSFAQEKRYGIESAILKKNTVMKTPGGINDQTIPSIQYFDDFGRKESSETTISMQGQTFSIFAMLKDNYMHTANLTLKQGTKVNLAAMVDDYKTVNYLNLTDEVKKRYLIEEKGNEQFLGRDCKSYELTITVQGQTVKSNILVWQGLPLKSTMSVAGMTIVEEVAEIQEGAVIPKEKFELPAGIDFTEINPQ